MTSEEEGIQVLSRAVQGEVRNEIKEILDDAQAKAEATRQRAQEQAAAERKGIMQRASQEAHRIRSQAVATARSKARSVQLERREKVLDGAFQAARRQLASLQQQSDYGEIAAHLLREALTRLQADTARVQADAQTRALLTDEVVAQISKDLGVRVEFGLPLAQGTGVIVETTDGHRRYDNTLETRLSRMQDGLRSPVYHVLVGESL